MNSIVKFFVKKKVESVADTAIKESSMSPAFKAWLIGLVNAAVSAIASGGVSLTVGVGMKHSIEIAAASALVSGIKWIAQHPIPGGTQ